MIAQVSSVDASQDLVVDAPMANEGDGWAGSGANPWHLDASTESILFLSDESDKPARIGFSVTGDGVRYYLTSLLLAPHETRAIDLRQLRDAQVADFENSRVPTVATDGSVTWVRIDNVPVAGRLVVISRSGGIASNYDCTTCNCPITLSSVGVTPGTCTMVPGGTMQCTATANYQNCNGYPFPSDVTDSSTWSSNNTPVSTVNTTGLETIQGGGTSTITASYRGATSYTYNCLKGCTCIEHDNPRSGSHGTSGTMLSCGSVTRGQTVTCSLSNIPAGATFSDWKFTDGTNNVTTTSTTSSWSGTAVKSGTVSVQVASGGKSPTLPASLTVNARNWHTGPASPSEVANGTLVTLPVPPQPSGIDSGLGFFREVTGDTGTANSTIIGSGPNTGYAYWAAQLSISTTFQYEINPDLENSTSQFSIHQWGGCGFISWSNLLAQTQRHEYNSATQSHYAFYKNSLSLAAHNPGDFVEQQVASPGDNLTQFASNTRGGLDTRYDQIKTDSEVEPFAVNESEMGTPLGDINYAPYASCP